MKLLLVEDDPDLRSALSATLKQANYILDTAADGEKAYLLASTSRYDLIILDYNLPIMDGRAVLEKLRQEKNHTPILILTVKGAAGDKTDLLNLGADDYLAKPFSTAELLARIKAVLRRPKSWQSRILKFKDLELDADRFLVTKGQRRIRLSSKEFCLLECLLVNQGRIVSRREIIENVWDENADPFSNTIEVHIRNLRKKLETDQDKMIFTFSGRGYKLDDRA